MINGRAGAEAEDGGAGLEVGETFVEAMDVSVEGIEGVVEERGNKVRAANRLTKEADTRGELRESRGFGGVPEEKECLTKDGSISRGEVGERRGTRSASEEFGFLAIENDAMRGAEFRETGKEV